MRRRLIHSPSARPGKSSPAVVIALCVMLVIASMCLWKLSHRHQGASAFVAPIMRDSAATESATTSAAQSPSVVRQLRARMQLQQLRAVSDPSRREEMLRAFLASVSSDDIADLLSQLQAEDHDAVADGLYQRLFRYWAEIDLAAASAWLTQMPEGALRNHAIEDAAILHANANLADAEAWAGELADDGEREHAVSSIANEAVRIDPIEALRLASTLSTNSSLTGLACRAAAEWASHDPQAAVEWIHQIPDETLRAKVLASAVTAWGDRDPIAAATAAVKELPPGRDQSDAVVSIAQRWAQQDPENTAAWVQQFPAGELRRAAIENVAAMWSQKDPMHANQWRNAFRSQQVSLQN